MKIILSFKLACLFVQPTLSILKIHRLIQEVNGLQATPYEADNDDSTMDPFQI